MNARIRTALGFTLVEVLLALAVIAIALTALLKISAQNVDSTRRIKERSISHWVAMQAVTMIQLNLVQLKSSQETSFATTMLNQKWYWRAKVSPTPVKSIQLITISTSLKQNGGFKEELTAFRYLK